MTSSIHIGFLDRLDIERHSTAPDSIGAYLIVDGMKIFISKIHFAKILALGQMLHGMQHGTIPPITDPADAATAKPLTERHHDDNV